MIKKLGPGLLFAGAAIGVSHLVQSTKAGAEFGFGLIWALILSNIFKYPFFLYGPKYAAATGESLLDGYLKIGRPVLITYLVLSLVTIFTIQSAVTIVTAGLAIELFGFSSKIELWAILMIFVCMLILLIGKYKFLDKLIKFVILLLAISTVLAVVFAANKSNNQISLQQVFPSTSLNIAFLVAFMGWMPAPLDISIWQSIWTLEKKKKIKRLEKQEIIFDFNIFLYTCICFSIF